MKALYLAVFILFSSASSSLLAATDGVFLGKYLCTKAKTICVKGSMEYYYSEGKLKFHGRVKNQAKPGTLTIKMKGASKKHGSHTAYVTGYINGKYSEIIDLIDNSVVRNARSLKWSIISVSYKT